MSSMRLCLVLLLIFVSIQQSFLINQLFTKYKMHNWHKNLTIKVKESIQEKLTNLLTTSSYLMQIFLKEKKKPKTDLTGKIISWHILKSVYHIGIYYFFCFVNPDGNIQTEVSKMFDCICWTINKIKEKEDNNEEAQEITAFWTYFG